MDIASLRALKGKNKIDKFTKSVQSNSNSFVDKRYWTLEGDQAGNGSAVIRFLPSINEDELDYVKIFSHGFKGPTGRWYIQNSLTTLGLPDPVAEENTRLWNTETKENQEIARQRKRRLSYISNILVVNDPNHPENNGKVFLYRYGKKIFDMISDMQIPDPAFSDEVAVEVFNVWEGANFKLKIRKVEGYTNYDKSEFAAPSVLADGDEQEMLRILNDRYDLNAEVAPDKFKSYDELKALFDAVIGGAPSKVSSAEKDLDAVKPKETKSKPAPVDTSSPFDEDEKETVAPSLDDDDDMAFFKNLAND